MEILRILDSFRDYCKKLEEDCIETRGGIYNLTAPVELRRILSRSSLEYNARFNPKKIRFFDYVNLRDALLKYQEEFNLDIQDYINELNKLIDSLAPTALQKKSVTLNDLRKEFCGKTIDPKELKNCENKRLTGGLLTFYFYVEDSFDEYKYDVTIHIDEMRIIAIDPMEGQKLKSESERRVDYVSCRTKTSHYAELKEILEKAVD